MGSAGLEAKFGSHQAGDGDIPYISRQGQPLEACRPPPAWRCTLTVGVWLVWESEQRFRQGRNRTERAKPFRVPHVNPH